MVERFLSELRGHELRWDHIVSDSSKTVMQTLLNQILWAHHVCSFERAEWGELTDFCGVQERLLDECHRRVQLSAAQLPAIVDSLQEVHDALIRSIDALGSDTPLLSAAEAQACTFTGALRDAYDNELRLKRRVAEFLTGCDYLSLPYEVVVAVGDMWSSRVYTNKRMVGHVEKFFEFEANGLRALMAEK